MAVREISEEDRSAFHADIRPIIKKMGAMHLRYGHLFHPQTARGRVEAEAPARTRKAFQCLRQALALAMEADHHMAMFSVLGDEGFDDDSEKLG